MSYLLPTNALVAVAWLRTVVPAVATTVPADNATWAASGFVQVSVVGGSPDIHVPVRSPVIGVDAWGVSLSSDRPPWGKTNQLMEMVRAATEDHTLQVQRLLTIGAGYENARVLSAWMMSEPREMEDDTGAYAHYQADMALRWVVSPR